MRADIREGIGFKKKKEVLPTSPKPFYPQVAATTLAQGELGTAPLAVAMATVRGSS